MEASPRAGSWSSPTARPRRRRCSTRCGDAEGGRARSRCWAGLAEAVRGPTGRWSWRCRAGAPPAGGWRGSAAGRLDAIRSDGVEVPTRQRVSAAATCPRRSRRSRERDHRGGHAPAGSVQHAAAVEHDHRAPGGPAGGASARLRSGGASCALTAAAAGPWGSSRAVDGARRRRRRRSAARRALSCGSTRHGPRSPPRVAARRVARERAGGSSAARRRTRRPSRELSAGGAAVAVERRVDARPVARNSASTRSSQGTRERGGRRSRGRGRSPHRHPHDVLRALNHGGGLVDRALQGVEPDLARRRRARHDVDVGVARLQRRLAQDRLGARVERLGVRAVAAQQHGLDPGQPAAGEERAHLDRRERRRHRRPEEAARALAGAARRRGRDRLRERARRPHRPERGVGVERARRLGLEARQQHDHGDRDDEGGERAHQYAKRSVTMCRRETPERPRRARRLDHRRRAADVDVARGDVGHQRVQALGRERLGRPSWPPTT